MTEHKSTKRDKKHVSKPDSAYQQAKRFTKEVKAQVSKIQEAINQLRAQLVSQLRTSSSKGHLTRAANDYLCYLPAMGGEELYQMLKSDLRELKKRHMRGEASKLIDIQKQKLEQIIESGTGKQTETFVSIVTKTRIYNKDLLCCSVDFQWPRKPMIEKMVFDPNIRATKLEIWSTKLEIGGVRVTLSNGTQSPIFKTRACEPKHSNCSVLQLDGAVRRIKVWQAQAVPAETYGHGKKVYKIELQDENGKNVARWVGQEHPDQIWTISSDDKIPQNESIIGMSGNRRLEHDKMMNLGFVTVTVGHAVD